MTTSRRLFKITDKRGLMIDRICTRLRDSKEDLEPEGYARSIAEAEPDEKLRLKKVSDCIEKSIKIGTYHDVFWATVCHTNPDFLGAECRERGWHTEFDVPLDIFNEAVDYVAELLDGYSKRLNRDYSAELNMLNDLKSFRNNN